MSSLGSSKTSSVNDCVQDCQYYWTDGTPDEWSGEPTLVNAWNFNYGDACISNGCACREPSTPGLYHLEYRMGTCYPL